MVDETQYLSPQEQNIAEIEQTRSQWRHLQDADGLDPGYNQEELTYLANLTKIDFLPDIAKTRLFAMFNRAVTLSNLNTNLLKAEMALGDSTVAQIRFFLPPGRLTPDVEQFLTQCRILYIATLSRAYTGFERRQQQTRSVYTHMDRGGQEEKKGWRQKLIGF